MAYARTQVYLEREDHSALKSEAHRRGVSLAELVRRVVAEHLRRPGGPKLSKSDYMRIVGLGRSGHKDGSKRHDEALDEAWRSGALR